MTPKDLAEELHCSRKTVHRYVAALLEVDSKGRSARVRTLPTKWVELIRRARAKGLSPTDPAFLGGSERSAA